MTKKNEVDGHEEFVHLFKRGLKFSEELLAENEKLRFRIASLEAESDVSRRHTAPVGGDALVEALKRQIQELEAERTRLLSSFQEVENLNRDYQQRYSEIEAEHNNLANLYISSYQLHSTLSFREVVQVVSEIVINLVGVSEFAMYLYDARSDTLQPIAGEGVDVASLPAVKLGEGVIGSAARAKERFIGKFDGRGPLAVIPLSTVEALIGAIVIDKLLQQKDGFQPIDFELFNLLGAHAATALLSALLREQVGNELAVLQVDRARALLA